MLNLPRGSLKDVLELADCESKKGATIMEYLSDQRMFDIANRMNAKQDEKDFMEQAKRMSKEER